MSDRMLPALLIGSGLALAFYIYRYLTQPRNGSRSPKLLQDSDTKYPVPLMEKIELSHDTRLFRFKLPSEEHRLGLPVGQHINLVSRINDELVIRSYTPVSSDYVLGHFDLVVKVYFKNTHPKFPDGGKMTQFLDNMQLGDCIDIRGPNGLLEYTGRGTFAIKANKKSPPTIRKAKKVGMIAGGSGLTPMYQLISQVVTDPDDKTELFLIYANQSPEDILCQEDLDRWSRENPETLKIHYTVDRPTDGWKGGVGFVNSDMIKAHLPAPSDETLILMCGPPPMIKFACIPNLDTLGYSDSMRFAY